MKITNTIVFLLSIITIIVTTSLFEILVPMLNNAGECRISEYGYGKICESIIGFKIPIKWSLTYETIFPVSIFFGVLCGAIVAVCLLLNKQNSK